MRLTLALLLPSMVAAGPLANQLDDSLDKRHCAANNCLRAVRHTKLSAARSADCSSYMQHMVSPTTATVSGKAVALGTSVPGSIPKYASKCHGIDYSSACSCIGITASTLTFVGVVATEPASAAPALQTTTSPATSYEPSTAKPSEFQTSTTSASTKSSSTTSASPSGMSNSPNSAPASSPVTGTTATTTTVSSGPGSTTVTTCNNAGWKFSVYANSVQNKDSAYSNYDPTVIQSKTPVYQGTTTSSQQLDFRGQNPRGSLYGSPSMDLTFITVDHVGYLYARQSGTYTFKSSNPDDITILWIGTVAKTGWTRENALLVHQYSAGFTASATMSLKAGEYYPVRFLYANAQQDAELHFDITAPDGTTVLPTRDIVQFSCDRTTALPFAA